MENSKINAQFIKANFSTMKYVSLIALGFSVYFLSTDYLFHKALKDEYLYLYKKLDIVFAVITVTAVLFFWLNKTRNLNIQKAGTIIFPYLILIWAAVITGIDFQMFGLSTYIVIFLFCTFYLYLKLTISIIFFFSSCIALLTTIYLRGGLNENFLPLTFLLMPISIFSVLVALRNYKNKLGELFNQEIIVMMNKNLLNSNEDLEIEVEIRTKEIQIALEKAEESDRLKSSFLQNMSHEIRTPLNAVVGFSQLITKPNLSSEKINRYSRTIRTSSEKIIRIISDVIEISQIQADQIKLNLIPFNIISLIDELVTKFKFKANEKGIDLLLKRDVSISEYFITSDKKKLQAILNHLIDNAIKFTVKGGVEITYELDQDNVKLSVKDTGIGISNEMQQIIFEPFRQVETGICRNYGGNGLGLAIINAYVKLLNGTVSLKSEANKGSTFYVTIPLNKTNSVAAQTITDKPNSSVNTILIAEDEISNYEYLLELLDNYKLNILHAENGQLAIDMCRANSNINLILMDIKMPIMDGYTAAKLIKTFLPDTIIIAQTAYALESEKEKFIGVFDDYITKPIKEDELQEALMKYLEIS
jgi:signal transduction histidine kinase/CheY-like chemotaxis protein